jgi:hypothetical protein
MSTSQFRELYDLFVEKALGSLDVGGRSYKYFLDSSRKHNDNIYVVDGQRWDAKSHSFIQGSSWTDLFFIEHPVLGVTQEPSTGFRHYKREHSLASLIINGRDLTSSPVVQLGSLESYLPGAESLKERVMSRFNEIISSSLNGTRKVKLNQDLDHRVIAVTITTCVSINEHVSFKSLKVEDIFSSSGTTAPVPPLLHSIWADNKLRSTSSTASVVTREPAKSMLQSIRADAQARVASSATPVVTHSSQAPVVSHMAEPTVREAPAPKSSALSEDQRKIVLERIIATLGNDPSKASAVILAVLG